MATGARAKDEPQRWAAGAGGTHAPAGAATSGVGDAIGVSATTRAAGTAEGSRCAWGSRPGRGAIDGVASAESGAAPPAAAPVANAPAATTAGPAIPESSASLSSEGPVLPWPRGRRPPLPRGDVDRASASPGAPASPGSPGAGNGAAAPPAVPGTAAPSAAAGPAPATTPAAVAVAAADRSTPPSSDASYSATVENT